jgi:hypothetical protein
MSLNVLMDNSKCSKAFQFSVEIWQHIVLMGRSQHKHTCTTDFKRRIYCSKKKEINANQLFDQVMGFDLPKQPTVDKRSSQEIESNDEISSLARFMSTQFAPTYMGRSAAIEFFMKVVFQDDQSMVFPIQVTTPGIPHEDMLSELMIVSPSSS